MQDAPHFDDVLGEVAAELAASVARAEPRASRRRTSSSIPASGSGSGTRTTLALLAQAVGSGSDSASPCSSVRRERAFSAASPAIPSTRATSRRLRRARSPSSRARMQSASTTSQPAFAPPRWERHSGGRALDRDAVESAARSGLRLRPGARHDRHRAGDARRLLAADPDPRHARRADPSRIAAADRNESGLAGVRADDRCVDPRQLPRLRRADHHRALPGRHPARARACGTRRVPVGCETGRDAARRGSCARRRNRWHRNASAR